jgi:hypothetical protein
MAELEPNPESGAQQPWMYNSHQLAELLSIPHDDILTLIEEGSVRYFEGDDGEYYLPVLEVTRQFARLYNLAEGLEAYDDAIEAENNPDKPHL